MASKPDIVYFVKESSKNQELQYSLRSVERNFKAGGRVWLVGGMPAGFKPDGFLRVAQGMPSKWENVRKSLIAVCQSEDISEKFWLFNDDFFILKPVEKMPEAYYDGSILELCERIEKRSGGFSLYTKQMRHLIQTLQDAGLATLNYALHRPMLIEKKKALEVLEKFPDEPMFRSLYGNYWRVMPEPDEDYKIRRNEEALDESKVFVSTMDESFKCGVIGRQLRAIFDKPSRFEV